MAHYDMIATVDANVASAQALRPRDPITWFAWWFMKVFGIVTVVMIPVQLVTTLIIGIATALSFGLLIFPISLVWSVMASFLMGTSWLWIMCG